MSIPDIDFPPEPPNRDWLVDINDREDIICFVPLSVEEDGVAWILAGSLVTEDHIFMINYDIINQSWQLFTKFNLNFDVRVFDEDPLFTEVGLKREDARVGRKTASRFGDHVAEVNGIGFVPYVRLNAQLNLDELQSACSCSGIFDETISRIPGLSYIEDEELLVCGSCSSVHGLILGGQRLSSDRLLSGEWLFGADTPGEIIEIGRDDAFLIYCQGLPNGRAERAIGLLTAKAGGTSEAFAQYSPKHQEAILWIQGETIAGFLTWTDELDGYPALQQLYVRERFRRNGIGSGLISEWVDTFCDHQMFYVEEPNTPAQNLLRSLGYWDGEPEAVEHYTLRGVSQDYEEATDMSSSRSGVI